MDLNFPKDLKWIEKITAPFLVTPNRASLIRIAAWTLTFLIIAHFTALKVSPQLPFTKEMSAQGLTPLASTPSDPRYTRLDIKDLSNSVVWVGGSSLAIANNDTYNFLPTEGAVSMKMASRLLDSYTMTLDAIERRPKAMVVVINPFWVMNDKSAFFKTNMMNSGAGLWANKNDWSLIPLLVSPGNMLWNALGQHHNVIANGYDYLKLAQPDKPVKPKKASAQKPKTLSYNQPMLFWISQRYETDTDFTAFDAKKWQVQAMAQNNIAESVWGQKILRNLFEKIRYHNIPTLVYVAPTHPDLERTQARVALRTVKGQIDLIAKDYANNNLRYIGQIPDNVLNTLTFTDYLHLSNSGTLPAYLNNEITKLIKNKEQAH